MSSTTSGEPGAAGDQRPPSETLGRFAAIAFAALLLLPLKDLIESHPSPTRLWSVLAALGAFVGVYVLRLVFVPVDGRPTAVHWVWVGVALALAIALVIGDGPERWATLFIFVSAAIGVRIGLPWALVGIGACAAAAAAVLLPTAPFDNAVGVSVEALALGVLTAGMRKLRAVIDELQEAREQLARLAVTEERLRFARDLHDLLGHSLSLIALKAELAGRLLPGDVERAAREVSDIDLVARRALAEAREAVSGYRQPTLASAVASGRMALEAAAIEGTWEIPKVALPEDIDAALGWAVREAVTNVIRHSRATWCWVRVTAGLAEASAEVCDDGVGHLDEPDAPASGSASSPGMVEGLPDWAGNGLSGLAERLSALGGRLDIAARPEGGLRLAASVPTPAALAPVPR